MARKKIEAPEAPDTAPLDGGALTAMQNLAGSIAGEAAEERDLLNQLLGQAQMADAFGKFSVTVTSSKMAYVKEHKLYRALSGKKSGNGYQFLGTWEEFCGLLGMSREKADQDIANLHSFGEEALESMSRMGIGYRELRQYRRLPDDQKAQLIEVAKSGDKDAFVDLAEDIIARHTQEKAALANQVADIQADYEAQGQVLAEKRRELDATKQDLVKAKRRIESLSANESAKEFRQELAATVYEVESQLQGPLRRAFADLAELAAETGEDHRAFTAALVRNLEVTLQAIRGEFHLPELHPDELPTWGSLLGLDGLAERG